MIDTYIERKKGAKQIRFDHPVLEKILGDTYGVIVFQEQVLHIANNLAGYSLGKADILRKAMGKKDANLMAEQKKEFLDGTNKNKIDNKTAESVFTQIETFARYGFNKAHSTCYAFVAYQTAWLKYYYPKEFMAALMSSEINNTDRIYQLLEECRRMKINVLPPDINYSEVDFSVVEDKIRFGLMAVKNVGEGPARSIVEERIKDGAFNAFPELVSRVPLKAINRRTIESLICAGACDSLEGNRAQKFEAIETMLEYGHKVAVKQSSHDLFADDAGAITRVAPELEQIEDWTPSQKLANEKTMLGFYISGHPLDKYRDELKYFTTCQIGDLAQASDGREVTIGGILTAVKTMLDKKGNMMAFATLEDYTGSVELILFSSCYDKCKENITEERMVLITGRVSTREGEAAKVIGSEVLPLDKLTERFNCQLVIKIDADCSDNTIERALTSLENSKGNTPVLLAARENGSEVYIKSDKYAVNLDFSLLNSLKELLGESGAYLRPLNKKENFS
jgi:DNA polymerase-3 subunit alpha